MATSLADKLTSTPITAFTGSFAFPALDDIDGTPAHGMAKDEALRKFLATATLDAGTITTSQPLTHKQTWNDGGVTFRGKENVYAITAAAAGSTVERWLGGAAGTTVLASISSTGAVTIGNGARLNIPRSDGAANATLEYTAATNSLLINNRFQFAILSDSFIMPAGGAIGFGASGVGDVFLTRDSANTLAQRNGTNAQAFRLYNTFTDASNYERLDILWASNEVFIRPFAAGTGSKARAISIGGQFAGAELRFRANSAIVWKIPGTGHLLAETDNTYDIGASGATRPRDLYLGTGLVVAGGQKLTGLLSATATLDFGSIAAQDTADLTMTVTGAAVGDSVALSIPGTPAADLVFMAWVSAADTVTIRAANVTGGAIDPASGDYRVTVFKF